MNLVDSSAWITYFKGEKNAESFAEPRHNAVLWTQDEDFRALPGVRYFG